MPCSYLWLMTSLFPEMLTGQFDTWHLGKSECLIDLDTTILPF